MKVTLDYDEVTNALTDANGMYIPVTGKLVSFESEASNKDVIDLIKLGVTCDEVIKMKNNDLIK